MYLTKVTLALVADTVRSLQTTILPSPSLQVPSTPSLATITQAGGADEYEQDAQQYGHQAIHPRLWQLDNWWCLCMQVMHEWGYSGSIVTGMVRRYID